MTNTHVYQYRMVDQPDINARGRQPRYGTRAAIESIGQIPLLDTVLELDERLLDADGFTVPEYLTYRIHVGHSHRFAGWTAPSETFVSARLQVMAGDYDARLTVRVFDPAIGAVSCLRVMEANQRSGGDLWIRLDDDLGLACFPDLQQTVAIVINGRRLTDHEELDAPS